MTAHLSPASPESAKAPIFPYFKPLEMADRPVIEAFTGQFEPYSDFCFSTLWFYNGNGQTRWCWLDGNLALRLHDGFGPGAYLTLLGANRAAVSARTLIEYARHLGCSPALQRVPEVTAEAIASEDESLLVAEDRDGFDYVHCTRSLVQLDGSSYAELRRDVRRFEKRHPRHRLLSLDLGSPDTRESLHSATRSWHAQKENSPTLENYCGALKKCLGEVGCFDLFGIGVAMEDSLIGFAVLERARKAWALSHFVAAMPEFTGLTGRLLHHQAAFGLDAECLHLNYQEDLGDPGLRRFKMKCAPSGFLRKYTVRLAARPA